MSEKKLNLNILTSETSKIRSCPGVVVSLLLVVISVDLVLGQGVSAEELQLPGIDELNRQADAELRLPGIDELDDGLELPSVCEIMGDCRVSGSGYPYSGYP